MIDRWIQDLVAWWETVTPEFAFLLALPFVIGAAGFLADRLRRRKPHTPVR